MMEPTDDEIRIRAMKLCDAEHGFGGSYKLVPHRPSDGWTDIEIERRRIPGTDLVREDAVDEWSDRWRLYRQAAHRELVAERTSKENVPNDSKELEEAVDFLCNGWRFVVQPNHEGRWLLRSPEGATHGWSYNSDQVRQIEEAHRARHA